jgi:hypothetical protein
MQTVAMIFNGVHFEPAVADKAFAYAKQSQALTIALFVKAAHEKPEGYGFPSDLGAAETLFTDTDADQDDTKIIKSNMRLLEHEAANQKITLQCQLLVHPSEEELNAALQDCAIIFIQGHDGHGRETPAGIDIKKLMRSVSVPVEIVRVV